MIEIATPRAEESAPESLQPVRRARAEQSSPVETAGASGASETQALTFHDEGGGYDLFGLHLPAVQRMVTRALPIYERYFRVASHGVEHIPATGPAILVANHSGALPIDSAMLCLDVLLRARPARIPRPIADRFIALLPFVSTCMARVGVVAGTRANVRRLLERGELLTIFPEGTTGVAKPFRDRYRLQEWRVGHAEFAIRHRAPVVPVAIVGAEESWPVVARIPRFHLFGAPYFPIPAAPFPLPSHFQIHYGRPIELHRDYPADAADDPQALGEAADLVRRALQGLLRKALARRRAIFR